MDNGANETWGNLKISIAQETFKVLIDEDQSVEIHLFSSGRMYGNSSPSLLYLVPDATGYALASPYDLPPSACPMGTRRLFFILPE
ncbi:MAG: hypothetical protein KAS19_09980 [Anaerolineales bacterium]|nr:hypothetical protein [Anaerolineales bacterium]